MKKLIIQQILSEYFDKYQIDQILQKLTGFTKNQLFFCEELDNIIESTLKIITEQSKNGIPFEYIINKAEFYGLDFYVDNRVLIPRNDTEIMVDLVIESLDNQLNSGPVLIDVGTGSSCIPLSILENSHKTIETHVVDISEKALEVSKINIQKYKNNIQQQLGSLYSPLISKDFSQSPVFITANLPYIKDNDFDNMSIETITHEPDLALYGGKETGFELYEQLIQQIIQQIDQKLLQTVFLYIEIGFDQKEYTESYLTKLGLKYSIHKDNSGIDRCVQIEFDSYLK